MNDGSRAAAGPDHPARLALLALVGVAAAVAAVALLTRWVLLEQHDRSVDRQLVADVAALEQLAAGTTDRPGGAASAAAAVFDRFLAANHPGADGVFLGIVDGEPHVRTAGARYDVERLQEEVRLWATRTSSTFGSTDTPAGPLRYVASPITDRGDVVATFVAGTFLQPGRDRVHDAVVTVTVVVLLVWCLAAAAGWLLLRHRFARAGAGDPSPSHPGDDAPEPDRPDDPAHAQLLAGASRELAAVATAVRAHLADAGPGRELSHGSLGVVRDELGRMGGVAEDLRLLGEVTGPASLRLEPVDVVALTSDVGEQAGSLGVREWEVRAAAHVVARLDADRVARAWLHLARNAVEHTWRRDRIVVFSDVVGSTLELGVVDAGRGIPPVDVEVLFEPFRRGPGTARAATAGGGLGLTVARAVAQAHGGRVDVRDTTGGGATVVLSIPLVPLAARAGLDDEPTWRAAPDPSGAGSG